MNDVFQELMEERAKQVEATDNSGMDNQVATKEPESTIEEQKPSGMEGEQQQVQEQQTTIEEIQQPQSVDYAGWLKEKSQGLFNTEDEFVSSLEKVKGYEDLARQKEELEKNQLPDDQFLKTLAGLRGRGANAEQIKEFVKLNTEYEDLANLSPKDLKIAKMILVDGYSKRVAEHEINKEFGFSNLDEDSDNYELDKELAEEKLKLSSKKDLEALEAYKAKLTTVDSFKLEEQKALQDKAIMAAHKSTVKETIPLIQNSFNGIGEISLKETLNGKDVTSNLSLEYDEDFKKAIPEMLEKYFSEKIIPINQNTIGEAKEYIDAIYWKENGAKIAEQSYKNGIALGFKEAEDKYVNPNGLKESSEQNIPQESALAAEWDAFHKRVEKWR